MMTSGFPSPASDFKEKKLDLDDLLIKNYSSTFFMKATGEHNDLIGIHDGDILIVDRSLDPEEEDPVVSISGNGLKIHSFTRTDDPDPEFLLWGVITWIIHSFRR